MKCFFLYRLYSDTGLGPVFLYPGSRSYGSQVRSLSSEHRARLFSFLPRILPVRLRLRSVSDMALASRV